MRNIIFQERERKLSSRITVPGRKVVKKERNNFSFDTGPGFELMTFHFAIPDSYFEAITFVSIPAEKKLNGIFEFLPPPPPPTGRC
jgi:hypothetical protein